MILLRINTKESPETITKFFEKEPSSIPVLLDKNGKVGKLFGLWAHPTSYLINRKGMVSYRIMGAVDWMGIEALSIIDHLLEK